jgi:transcriptional regulator with XRE-family HTH domain
MTIGQNVKQRREAKRWNQSELATKANVTQAMISKLEGGDDNPKINTLRSIATALDCLIIDLLPESDKKKPPRDKPL